VTAGGSVAFPDEVLIGGGAENQNTPRVSFDGTNYLVTWGGNESPQGCGVAARVASDGNVLDSSGIALPFAGPTAPCDVAAAAGGWLVVSAVFDADTSETRIDGVRIAGDGSVDGSPFPIAEGTSFANQRVSRGAGGWLVVWENNGTATISGARVDDANHVLDSTPLPIAELGTARLPRVAFDGSDWLVAWSDYSDWSWGDPFGVRVSSAGAVVDAARVDLGPSKPMEADVALTGGNGRWLTLYTRHSGPDDGVYARFITTGCADPTDSDGDTVADCADACPTAPGSPPSGCPLTGEGGAAGDGAAGSAAGSDAGGGHGNVGGSAGNGGSGRGGSTGGTGAEAGESAGGVATGGRGGSSGKGGSAGTNAGGRGEAGTAAEGGAANHGGGSGKGGTAGKAGAAGKGGAAGAGGSSPPDEDGCGCSVPASDRNEPLAMALGLVAVGSLMRRRRGGQSLRGRGSDHPERIRK
ncbi:MAG TPA: MYXO-CTERM sorting domain-containing protein, partial [Polyangiaceae bacterium]|nr:MYXO-CTERM sorting domain-containing protein [Polyangiaceae bacterium]